MYKVIACGVNRGPEGDALSFAEKDARDIADFFSGALGPPDMGGGIHLLTGEDATTQNIRIAIIRAALDPSTQYLVFYFSGHGSRSGILAADGILSYESIIRALRSFSVPYTTVILDVCFAASYLGFLKESQVGSLGDSDYMQFRWIQALADATPGNRLIFSTASDRLSGESSELRNGYFTSALLRALKTSRGDIRDGDVSWISDQRAFFVTKFFLKKMTSGEQIPVEYGLTGDFPLAISQADTEVGDASILRALVIANSLDVNVEVEYRRHVETRIVASLVNALGREVYRQDLTVKPSNDITHHHVSFKFPYTTVRGDGISSLDFLRYGVASLKWHLSIVDTHGHVLDEKIIAVVWISSREHRHY